MPGFTTLPIRTLRTGETRFVRQKHALVYRVLKSLENCRNLPCYQEPFLVILSVEVLARLVRGRWKLRDELLPILQIILNNTWNPGHEIQEFIGHRKAISTKKQEE